MKRSLASFAVLFGLTALAAGCGSDGQPTLVPNPEPALRKTSSELASDAAKRSYEVEAPKGENVQARGEYSLVTRKFEVANLSDTDWENVEVWVNQKFVVLVPHMVHAAGTAYRIDFEMLYDRDGHHFETDGGKTPVQSLQFFRDGKMYDVTATLE
jgi:predicted small lipoprotein YifL